MVVLLRLSVAATLAIVLGLGWPGASAAGAPTTEGTGAVAPSVRAPGEPLVVVAKSAPPFVERASDGTFGGFAVDLWAAVAQRLGRAYRWQEADLAGVLSAVAAGEADVAVGALTMTAERERRLDFTHPWLTSGLAIAVPSDDRAGWLAVVRRFFSLEFLQVLAMLGLLLVVFGTVLWLAERRHNAEQFGGRSLHGVGEGFWWAAVTMTTVGYGDRFPVTRLGRAVALVWMFTALIVISTFTAAMTSALTVGELGNRVRGPDDLGRVRVVTVQASASAAWLGGRRVEHATVGDLETALRRVAEGEADAVVYDAPLLRHRVDAVWSQRLRIVPGSFARQDYAFALAPGSPLREDVNRAILALLEEPEWQQRLARLRP